MISVVLFDLGGVVCRFEPGPRLTALARLSELPEREVLARVWESGLTRDFDLGRYTSDEWRLAVNERLGLALDFEAFEAVMLSALTVDEATVAVVDAIDPRVRVAMLTDNPPLLLDAIPRRFPGLASRFDPMLFSFQLGVLKPSAEAFARALARLGVPAGEVLFIDDTLANVEAAHAIGMEAVRFTSAGALREHLDVMGLLRRS
jgi:putative hydrolase of the HAD superfamily